MELPADFDDAPDFADMTPAEIVAKANELWPENPLRLEHIHPKDWDDIAAKVQSALTPWEEEREREAYLTWCWEADDDWLARHKKEKGES